MKKRSASTRVEKSWDSFSRRCSSRSSCSGILFLTGGQRYKEEDCTRSLPCRLEEHHTHTPHTYYLAPLFLFLQWKGNAHETYINRANKHETHFLWLLSFRIPPMQGTKVRKSKDSCSMMFSFKDDMVFRKQKEKYWLWQKVKHYAQKMLSWSQSRFLKPVFASVGCPWRHQQKKDNKHKIRKATYRCMFW